MQWRRSSSCLYLLLANAPHVPCPGNCNSSHNRRHLSSGTPPHLSWLGKVRRVSLLICSSQVRADLDQASNLSSGMGQRGAGGARPGGTSCSGDTMGQFSAGSPGRQGLTRSEL